MAKEDSADATPQPTAVDAFIFPEAGEALLTDRQVAAGLGISVATVWAWNKDDEQFPRPVRKDGGRFTRWKLSELRTYIKNLETGTPKPKPVPRQRISNIENDFRELR